jgi:general secretion pathway protein B
MSYILDALKKLETDKDRKARGSGMVNIAGELFKNGPAPPKVHRNWPLILGLVLLASLLTFGATYLLLHEGKGRRKRHTVSLPLALPAPVVSVPQKPALPATIPKPPVPVAPSGPPAAASPRHAAPLPVPAPQAAKAPSARHPRVAAPARPEAPAAGESVPAEPARPAAVSLVPAPADIKVSGIAWQDHRPSSRVVVNGFLLREGDTVSGARIVEIFQNRVRFSSAAGTFEVYLVATGLPAAPK